MPTCRRAFPLSLAHHVRCARITVGVGKIGSHAMPGWAHPTSASLLLAFPHSSPATKIGGPGTPRSFFYDGSSPLCADHEGQEPLSAFSNLFPSLYYSLAYTSLRIPWEEPNILTNDTVTFDERHVSVTTRCLRNERMVYSFYYHDLSQGQSVLERTCAHARAWEDLSGNS